MRKIETVTDRSGMSILQNILMEKEKEVAERKQQTPLFALKSQVGQTNQPRGFSAALRKSPPPTFIAEIKRASPSRGTIRADLDPVATAKGFMQHGASCLSVLTDKKFFQGDLAFLSTIRAAVPGIPLLRKDFMIDVYQIWEARVAGADAVLLIVAALSDAQLGLLVAEASAAELDILVEVHDEQELERALDIFQKYFKPTHRSSLLVGINNRNLHTFETNLSVTEAVLRSYGESIRRRDAVTMFDTLLFVSESGIKSGSDVTRLVKAGAHAMLVGESLVMSGDPGENLGRLIAETACS